MQHQALTRYLETALGSAVQIQALRPLTGDESACAMKESGAEPGRV
jgi:hypothetical protein